MQKKILGERIYKLRIVIENKRERAAEHEIIELYRI